MRKFLVSWYSSEHWGLQQVGPVSASLATAIFDELLYLKGVSSLRLREVDAEWLAKNNMEVNSDDL